MCIIALSCTHTTGMFQPMYLSVCTNSSCCTHTTASTRWFYHGEVWQMEHAVSDDPTTSVSWPQISQNSAAQGDNQSALTVKSGYQLQQQHVCGWSSSMRGRTSANCSSKMGKTFSSFDWSAWPVWGAPPKQMSWNCTDASHSARGLSIQDARCSRNYWIRTHQKHTLPLPLPVTIDNPLWNAQTSSKGQTHLKPVAAHMCDLIYNP